MLVGGGLTTASARGCTLESVLTWRWLLPRTVTLKFSKRWLSALLGWNDHSPIPLQRIRCPRQ